jgi:hypothetical protein
MTTSRRAVIGGLAALAALAGCTGSTGGGAAGAAPPRVRVPVPAAKCEVALPANMTVVKAQASGFTLVEQGKNPDLDGMLIVVMPIGPVGGFTPPGAIDVKILKDVKGPDGAVAREWSYNNGLQTLHAAEYVYPIGNQWLHCKISAARTERRDEVARLCAGLAPKAL